MVSRRTRAAFLVLGVAGCPFSPAAGPEPDGGTDASRPPTGEAGLDARARDGAGPDGSIVPACGLGPGSCDVVAQDCLPTPSGVERNCQVVTAASGALATACAVVANFGADGWVCSTGADCAPGLACVPDGLEDVCRAFCCAASGVGCPIAYRCQSLSDGSGGASPFGVCLPEGGCTVLPQSGCAPGDACVPTADGDTTCTRAGVAAVGSECGVGCVAGAVCASIGATSSALCYAICDPDLAECPAPTWCTSVTGLPPGYGVCYAAP